MMKKQRLYGLDVLRIFAVLMVCAFHTWGHLKADYGIFTPFVSQGAMFMTLFFMLSGYSLFLGYSDKSFSKSDNFISFFKKRFISIVPMYWVVGLLYAFAEILKNGGVQPYKRLCFFL